MTIQILPKDSGTSEAASLAPEGHRAFGGVLGQPVDTAGHAPMGEAVLPNTSARCRVPRSS